VSTQILESTITNFIPSRADVLDLANIVMDGASGIMFCMETASTLRPAYTISVAKKIIFDAERYKDTYEK
jgi:pyruvate kinase